ncbi:hypothetical protein WDZ11_00970 [Roseomonas mucosa]|uniref:hypothetical protein n=1 Tax=Roseomonas mucosa TaxID=207340 RepID=UPI0028CCA49B|nr:hypothetical protein [Roseomonas sp. DSM 102946]
MSESGSSAVDWEAARAEFEAGASVNALSKRYGVTRAAVYWQAKERGWRRPGDAASLGDLPPFDAILLRWARRLIQSECKIVDRSGGVRFADLHLPMVARDQSEAALIRQCIPEIMEGPPA